MYAIYVRDLRTRRDFAYAICVRDAIFRANANRVRKPVLRTRNAARLAPQNRVRGIFLMPCLLMINTLFLDRPKNLGGPIVLLSYVRPSVRPSVRMDSAPTTP